MFRFSACPYSIGPIQLEQEGKVSETCASVGLRAMLRAMKDFTDLCSSKCRATASCRLADRTIEVDAVTTETGF